MNFEWSLQKSEINLKKHCVSFEEAKTVFDDPLYVDFYDPDHSDGEHRYLIIGRTHKRKLLIVSYTERDNIIRLISARKSTRKEQKAYADR
ncbi:MAG: BrnT family toxin [Bacteroidales bacterium]|nr:BrnT family toxin [Bacteroidales bacterium]